jgi:hypothetical protein
MHLLLHSCPRLLHVVVQSKTSPKERTPPDNPILSSSRGFGPGPVSSMPSFKRYARASSDAAKAPGTPKDSSERKEPTLVLRGFAMRRSCRDSKAALRYEPALIPVGHPLSNRIASRKTLTTIMTDPVNVWFSISLFRLACLLSVLRFSFLWTAVTTHWGVHWLARVR